MRNILIHGYFGINLEVVWDTATEGLPELKAQIQSLPELPEGQPAGANLPSSNCT